MTTPDFKAPGAKMPRKRKLALFAVGGVIGLGGVLLFMRNRNQNAAANTSSTDTTGTTADTSGIDPNTGVPYADELASVYNPATGSYLGYGSQYPYTSTGVTGYATNAEWAQGTEAYLTQQGYDPATVAAAIGLYFAGMPLSQNQYDIIQAAIGFEGQPPNGAPPPKLTGGGGGGQGGGGSGGGKTVTVPDVQGYLIYNAYGKLAAAGFRPHATGKGNYVRSQNPGPGAKAKRGDVVTLEKETGRRKTPGKGIMTPARG